MKKWFSNPLAYIAIVVAILCGTVFVGLGITGFNKLPGRIEEMELQIVDQDQTQVSKAVTNQLKDNLPLKVSTNESLSDAKSELENRKTELVVTIPKNFMNDIQNQKDTQLSFYVNDSNGMLQNSFTKSLITQAESKIQTNLTSQKTTQAISEILSQSMSQSGQENAQQQNQQAIQQQATKIASQLEKGVSVETVHLNKMSSNYQYQMTPMFLNLGSYLGIMLMSVVLTMMFMGARFTMGKTKAYIAMQANGILGTIILPIVTVSVLHCIISFDSGTYWHLIFSQILFGIASFELTAALAMLMGSLPSMILQLPLLVMQTIAGGGILSRTVMNDFYQWVSKVTPMYQGVYSTFNALFGGDSSALYSSLVWIAGISLFCGIAFAWIGHRKSTKGLFSGMVKFN